MDTVTADLGDVQRRQVILCGQRLACNLPARVAHLLPTTTRRKEINHEENQTDDERGTAALGPGTADVENEASVGTGPGTTKSGGKRKRASRAKQSE